MIYIPGKIRFASFPFVELEGYGDPCLIMVVFFSLIWLENPGDKATLSKVGNRSSSCEWMDTSTPIFGRQSVFCGINEE